MKKMVKISTPLFILSFLIWTIAHNWSLVGDKIASANINLFLASLFILSLTYLGGAYFWYKILHLVSFQTSFQQAFRVFIISNFGRFIPGVVLHYVARVYLSKGLGLGVKEGLSTVLLEAYYNIIGAAMVSILALPMLAKFLPSSWLFLLVAVASLLIIFVQPVKIFALLSGFPYLGKHLAQVKYKNSFVGHLSLLGLSSALFLLYGLAFFLLSSAFVDNQMSRILDLSGLLAVSWIVGFLTPVAPGGLGVSDFSLAFLLQPFYDFSLSSFLALAFRLNLFIAEGLMFLLVIKLFGWDVVGMFKKKEVV